MNSVDQEMEYLSRQVARHLAGGGIEEPEVCDLARRLRGLEDRVAVLSARPPTTIERMVGFVATWNDCRPSELTSARRSRVLAWGRFAIMWAAKELTPYSFPRIGRALGGFDHTSVIHGCRRAEELRASNDEFLALTDALLEHFASRKQPEEDSPCLPL